MTISKRVQSVLFCAILAFCALLPVAVQAAGEDLPRGLYTVTFHTNGGSIVEPLSAEAGSLIIEPVAPVRAGYAFAGWYKDSKYKTRWNFTADTVSGNVTLFAKWVKSYTVTFQVNSGSVLDPISVAAGRTITPPADPTRDGYRFAGWFIDSRFKTAWNFAKQKVSHDTVLYAKWIATEFSDGILLRRETDHFKLFCRSADEASLADIAASLESAYTRITQNLKQEPGAKTYVNIYPNISTFRAALNWPNVPRSVAGVLQKGVIKIVSPKHPAPGHTYESTMIIAVHEFSHTVILKINPNVSIFLNEGIAKYVSLDSKYVKQNVQRSAVLQQSIQYYLSLPADNFVARAGSEHLYEVAYAFVDYVVSAHGYDKLIALIQSNDTKAALGMDDAQLQAEWTKFLLQKYS